MKRILRTDPARDGFSGCLFGSAQPADRCLIVLLGDEDADLMNKACAKWLTGCCGCDALCIGVRQPPAKDTGVHLWPLDRIEAALHFLQGLGYAKVGILGMSMQAALALSAACRLPELSLVLALSPNDFVPWGFVQGPIGKSRHGEWPSGTSSMTWRGQPLPYQPAGLEKDAYWALACQAQKQYGEMHTITVFNHSEAAHPVTEDCRIPVEQIAGRLVLVGAADDVMWDSAGYIRRMTQRLAEKQAPAPEVLVYPHGTHLLVPEAMMRAALPLFGDWISRMYVSGRQNAKACKQARCDLQTKLDAILRSW